MIDTYFSGLEHWEIGYYGYRIGKGAGLNPGLEGLISAGLQGLKDLDNNLTFD